MPSLTRAVRRCQPEWLPLQLVRSFLLEVKEGALVRFRKEEKENHQRLVVIDLAEPIFSDHITLTVHATYGLDTARVFEIMVY